MSIPFFPKFHAQKSSIRRVQIGILRIVLLSIAKKVWSMISVLQVALELSMSSLMIVSGLADKQVIGLIVVFHINQLSAQIFVVVPSPILLINPWHMTSLPSMIAHQTCEGRLPSSAESIVPLG